MLENYMLYSKLKGKGFQIAHKCKILTTYFGHTQINSRHCKGVVKYFVQLWLDCSPSGMYTIFVLCIQCTFNKTNAKNETFFLLNLAVILGRFYFLIK